MQHQLRAHQRQGGQLRAQDGRAKRLARLAKGLHIWPAAHGQDVACQEAGCLGEPAPSLTVSAAVRRCQYCKQMLRHTCLPAAGERLPCPCSSEALWQNAAGEVSALQHWVSAKKEGEGAELAVVARRSEPDHLTERRLSAVCRRVCWPGTGLAWLTSG